jgi:TRAP-type mannitol/chloroaromatic compound transport system permease large subunit
LPAMMRNKYSPSLATGTIAASGTLGQIIPPSIVLIILADQLAAATDQAGNLRKILYKQATGEISMPSIFDVGSTSAGEMFLGALIPGLVLVALYMVYILIYALIKPEVAPAVSRGGAFDRKFMQEVVMALVPPLALIFLVLGAIITGVATVNQAGAIGAAGALIMAGYRLTDDTKSRYYPAILGIASVLVLAFVVNNFNMNIKLIRTNQDLLGILIGVAASLALAASLIWSGVRVFKIENTLHEVMVDTAKTTSLVFVILMGASILTAAFRAFGGEELVREFLFSLPGGFWTKFIVVMGVIFILGFFLDFIEISVVVVPIVAPILLADPSANVTAVWLGVMIGLNIQTSFLTPPFGFALFYLRGVAPAAVKTIQMYKGVIPFIGLQLLALVVVANFPALVNYLPNRVALTSDTAPPPVNPQLQYCLGKYVFAELENDSIDIRAAIANARLLDISYLPKDLQTKTRKGLDNAETVFERRDEVLKAEAEISAAAIDFRPLHSEVRFLQKDIIKIDVELKSVKNDIDIRKSNDQTFDGLVAYTAELNAQRQQLESAIPGNWKVENEKFSSLRKAEKLSRRKFQRTTDQAYEVVAELISTISSVDQLAGLGTALDQLSGDINGLKSKEASKVIGATSRLFNSIQGTAAIRKQLSRARKALRGRKANFEKAQKSLAKAVKVYQKDLQWRQRAKVELLPGLLGYDVAIRNTVGLRLQPQLPREQALIIAGCNSVPRDISLNF